MRVRERMTGGVFGCEHRAARVAARAHLDLRSRRAGRAAVWETGGGIHDPRCRDGVAHPDREPGIARLRSGLGPRRVRRSRPVARLARHVDLGEGGAVRVGRRVVALRDVRRVALRAHEVPVLVRAGPMEHIVVRDRFLRIEVEPALPAFLRRARVPHHVQRLIAAAREGDEVLLERVHAEGVRDLVVVHRAVGAVRVDEELAVARGEGARDAEVRVLRALEIPQHGCGGGRLHREVVVRAAPERILLRVACGARGAADERRVGRVPRGASPSGRGRIAPHRDRAGDEQQRHRDDDRAPRPRGARGRRRGGGLHGARFLRLRHPSTRTRGSSRSPRCCSAKRPRSSGAPGRPRS